MPPSTTSPLTIGTCPETKSHPSAWTARENGRCWPPEPLPPSAPYRLIVTIGSSLLSSPARNESPGASAGRLPILVRQSAIHPDCLNACGLAHGIGIRSGVAHRCSVEQHQIGAVSLLHAPTALQSKALGGKAGHF